MNNNSIILSIFLSLFLVLSPRRLFFFPFVAAACFAPMNQRLILFNLDFTLLRILILIGLLRLTIKGETRDIHWNKFDKLILSWGVVGSLIYSVQQSTADATINRAGLLFDSLGMYWLFRQILHEWEDVLNAIKFFALFAIITAPLIALENLQVTNFFSLFGPTQGQFHRDRFRAAGSFPHYIMMGSFWASLLPFFYARIKAQKDIYYYWLAIAASLSNVYCSASSTSIFTVVAIIFAWQLYNLRMHGKILFWGACVLLLLLHLIMNAPVWHLLSRIDIFGGSTGYHRYNLVDKFLKNIQEWFFLGTKSTEHWGWGLQDITNQFVLEGVRGGIATLIVFIILTYCAVKIPGKLSLNSHTPDAKWMSWAICVAMLGHFATFWGVSYFGQINMLLTFCFALVAFSLEKSSASEINLSPLPR